MFWYGASREATRPIGHARLPEPAIIGRVETVRTTCPRDCYDACGVLVGIEDGRVKHVRGDPGHHVSRGKLCRKCSIGYNGAFLDPAVRLTTPLRRSGPKGEGLFEPIGWPEAIEAIADGLTGIAAEHGADRVLNAHYTGTCALIDGAFPQRFFNRLGATEVEPDTVCNNAGHVALSYVYGSSEEGFDPEAAATAACIVVWGANPSASAPHQHDHWLREAPGEVIVIDPIRTPSATAADTYLQLRPGSDAALAFALAHVIRREGLVDHDFVRDCVLGYDELEPLLDGCTPAWGERGDRRACEPDRARRARLRRGSLAALDGPGAAAPAARRQRDARHRDAAGADRQHPAPRLGLPLPQRRGVARGRLRLARGRRARSPPARRRPSARWIWPRCSPTPGGAARSCAGTSIWWRRAPSRRR